jgi:hypothetical protein
LSRATAAFLTVLDAYTIADLVHQNDPLADLLGGRAA